MGEALDFQWTSRLGVQRKQKSQQFATQCDQLTTCGLDVHTCDMLFREGERFGDRNCLRRQIGLDNCNLVQSDDFRLAA